MSEQIPAKGQTPDPIEPGQLPAMEVAPPSRAQRALREIVTGNALISVLAVVLALVVGAVLIAITDPGVRAASGLLLLPARRHRQGDLGFRLRRLHRAVPGSIYNFGRPDFADGIKPLTETLTFATPLIAAGLGVALGFRVGLFNIGGRGQMLIAAASGRLGRLRGSTCRPGIHLIVALVAGIVGGALWGGHRRPAQGAHRRARGDRHDHAQLRGVLPHRLHAPHPRAAAGAGLEQPEVAGDEADGGVPAHSRALVQPHPRVHPRDHRHDLGLVAALPLEPGLPVPRRRREPARGPRRRHQRQEHVRLRDAHLRGARRSRRSLPGARHGDHRLRRRHRRRHRLRRDHRRAARAAPGRGECSPPASCSARSRPADSRCRPPRACRSTSCSSCSRSSCCSSRRRRWCGRSSGCRSLGDPAGRAGLVSGARRRW